ncbi:MAG: TonB-dependent receptor family protein [Thiotrichales bacterium]
MNNKSKRTTLGVWSALAMVPAVTSAQDHGTTLDPISVQGILPHDLESVPGSFYVIDEYDLEQRRPFSVKEALRAAPGIHVVDEDSAGTHLNIGVRGLDPRRTSRTLLLEDGMPLFLAPYGDPSAHYSTPLDRVQRIEVVKGSGQVLYGPQTIGGMINFVTQPVPTDGVKGSLSTTLGSNEGLDLHGNVGVGGDAGGIMVDALRKTGDGVRDNHDYEVDEYTLKGQLNLNERNTLIAKISRYEEDSHVSETGLGAIEFAENRFQAPTGKNDRFNHERDALQLSHIFEVNEKATLKSQAYYVDAFRSSFRQINDPGYSDVEVDDGESIVEGDEASGRSAIERCPDTVDNTNLANGDLCGGRHRPRDYQYGGVESRLDFSHGLFGLKNDAVIGVRVHEEDIRRRQFRDSDPRAQSLDYLKSFGDEFLREDIRIDVEAQSYYAQNTLHTGDWSITPGVRVEKVSVKTDVVFAEGDPQEIRQTNNFTEVLPALAVAWKGIENATIFAGIHQGIGPPRPDRDLAEVEVDGEEIVLLSKTKPEKSTNLELGVRSHGIDGLVLESTLFHTDFDEIVISDDGRFFNGGESKQTGIELAGHVDLGAFNTSAKNLYLAASYTHLFTAEFTRDVPDEDIVAGNRLPYAPKHLLSLSVGYEHPGGFDARLGVDYVSKQYVDGENTIVESLDGTEGTIPAYSILNASINYRLRSHPLTIFANAYNLADKAYLVSRVDGKVAGRERLLTAGLRYDF